jgi:hypothetical protein
VEFDIGVTMKPLIGAILGLASRPVEIINNFSVRPKLKNQQALERFRELSVKYPQVFSLFSRVSTLERGSEGYSWDSWSGKIRSAFQNGVDLGFLANPLIAFTMVLAGKGGGVHATRVRIEACREILGEVTAKSLLLEDYVGLPIISDAKFMTSANRAHHASHLAYYYQLTGKEFWKAKSIVEWGGGYGNMARIIRRMNPTITYIIVDLPELLALQYVYLGSLEGVLNINIIASEDDSIATGKINLIPSELLLAEKFQLECDSFISTWALTECPEYIQRYVNGKQFFSAKQVFIASRVDDNNCLPDLAGQHIARRLCVPNLNGHHEYWVIEARMAPS